ncbi:related to nucleoside-diphosphate-sugar epimerase [Ramularia collo-cygni]|uniref:Related to nucleoside-diphosphate-sugar epimerase n=1 Tax=Ramularia collo-cygni TaxID=112498 RepID=A0A2D3UXN1_9PEZI|nr:related to nucleoside-diphosphate-sugar epimerase [Ramularia collo-cygni]CZT17930.1 related to nucleoside-diphosphate-sugar epimerase [Ramularia collo-cygni]
MAPKIFITGVTGYIAGDALHVLNNAHPEYEYTALVRSQEKADKVKSAYPKINIVLGGLDDSSLLEEEASKADIVLHAADASDHEGAAKSIARGLAKGHSKEHPGFWLHTGGTGILTYFDSSADKLGEWEEKEFNDYSGVSQLTNLPDEAFHRNVDKIVLEAGVKNGDVVKTAIVCPPTIYGHGRGPVSGRGRQVYEMSKLILQKGYAPVIGQGKARWNNVHVHDLSDVFVLLVEAAVQKNLSDEIWGERGYFLTENGEHLWSDLSKLVAKKAADLGYINKDPKEQSLSKQEALDVAGFEAVSWGLNSRAKAERARKVLGWKPSRPSLEDEVEDILKREKALLG